jgi:2-oxoglutarate/2-oxoacid ferredoxin oxidoreductase subunit alpha
LIEENEVQVDLYMMEDADVALVAYGTPSRIVKSAIEEMRAEGIKVGLIRPKTLYPFPFKADPCGSR